MVTVSGSTITDNVASVYGGGIYGENSGTSINIADSSLTGNQAGSGGGGAIDFKLIDQGSMTNVTIAGNKAGRNGGGTYRYSGSVKANNTIISLNEGLCSSYKNTYGSFGSGSTNNLIGDVPNPGFVRDPDDGGDGWGNENDDYGDLRLTLDSPAINAGSNAAVADPETATVHWTIAFKSTTFPSRQLPSRAWSLGAMS